MNIPNLRPLSFGEILDGAFTLYRRNFVTFAVTALIPAVIMAAVLAFMGVGLFQGLASGDRPSMFGMLMLFGLVGGLVFLAMWGALAREASQSYTGQPTSVGDGFSAGLRAALPLIGAGFVAGIAFIVVIFAVGLVMGLVTAASAALGSGILTLLVGIVMFCAMAAVYLGGIAVLFAVLPAIVVEHKGPVEAISRSFELARGALGRVVGLMLVAVLITYLPIMAVMLLTGTFTSFGNPDAMPSTGQLMTQQVLALGIGVLTNPFLVAVMVLLYYDRRVRTEALDVQILTDRLAVV
jgi:hypothetical protein